MKSRLIISLLLLTVNYFLFASYETESLLGKLDQNLKKRDHFIQLKEDRIRNIKKRITEESYDANPEVLYSLYEQLYNEYKSFKYDSAFSCVNQLNELALDLNNYDRLTQSKLYMGFTLLSAGLFNEALDSLGTINPRKCSITLRQEYYCMVARASFDLADYSNDDHYSGLYNQQGNVYIDSAISFLNEDTPDYWSAVGLKKMKSNDYLGAVDAFNFLLTKFNISSHQYAIATSSVGYIYTILDRKNEAIDMLIRAAIADVEASTKETVALRNLAVLLFEKGDIDRAYSYIMIALDDATFYNARHRKIEVGSVLPIIEGERLHIVENQKQTLSRYAVIVTVLSGMVLIFSLVIFFQLRRLVRIKKVLQKTNNELQEMNTQLTEANIIKEEYIGYFFNINSEFISKIESYRKNIQRKLAARMFGDLENIIKSTDLKKERENMYLNFDKIFLKLFPRFVEEFNSYFREEDHIVLKNDELLNADLRIIALMRLGITDSEKIANFLGFSVNTVYTYKTKLKHKAIDKEHFDERIMQIKAL